MTKWEHVRRAAREFRESICRENKNETDTITTAELLQFALKHFEVRTRLVAPGHPDLPKGTDARVEDKTIYCRNDVDEWLAIYFQLHEIGHLALGHGERECSEATIDPEASESKVPFGVHRVEGYGTEERIECEANIFAREYLLPRDLLTNWFVRDELNAAMIAERTGMAIDMVCHQLAFALLTPAIDDRPEKDEETTLTLNPSQQNAAEVPEGPQLVDAGPGTGKTRTLVARVLHLLGSGISAENILVLTFSNKACAELRERLDRFAPESTASLTIETFHSFGLELLRKYGTEIGLPEKIDIIDPVEAILLLEQMLPDLGLDYYQYLPEPSKNLPDIARAISRAKDENAGPEHYQELAAKQRTEANGDESIEAAENMLEAARVYTVYQKKLADMDTIDLADLICRSIELLSTKPDVRASVRAQFAHVLVDEYQDVNRASGILLRELVGDGKNLWAVGDLRQSIHRWRGATTANIRRFHDDFPLAKEPISLARNYRSRRGIVDLVSSFAPQMAASRGREFDGWEVQHEEADSPSVQFHAAADPEAESRGIATEILRLHKGQGYEYRDQAVICRTHAGMARVAAILTAAGVPLLYMGDLFERPEIRDLLALISLASDPGGSGLVRVARFPEYDIDLADVMTVIKTCREKSMPFPGALDNLDEIDGISDEGRTKLKLVAEHLSGLTYGKSAWKCLTRYIFERSRYLAPYLIDSTPAGQQRKLAIYQFLQFVHSRLDVRAAGVDPKRELLRYIRRLEIFGDEKQLREPDEWTRGIDAVRMMTIHASKGLEFRAVFIPGLYKGNMPNTSNRRETCPAPNGLLSETETGWRDHEEECLFFVAMSRAREKLYLSRPLTRSGKNSNPSDFLAQISSVLPTVSTNVPTWTRSLSETVGTDNASLPRYVREEAYRLGDIELYAKCSLSFFYRHVVGLSGKREDTGYLEFHRAVHKTVASLRSARDEGQELTSELTNSIFDDQWKESGPTDHFLAELYESTARQMVANAVETLGASNNQLVSSHEIKLGTGTITIDFDLAEVEDGGEVSIKNFKTGRQTKTEGNKDIYALLHKAAAEMSPGKTNTIATHYLRDNTSVPVTMTDKVIANRTEKFEKVMKDISDGQFYPIENDHDCPRCAHYFICPAAA